VHLIARQPDTRKAAAADLVLELDVSVPRHLKRCVRCGDGGGALGPVGRRREGCRADRGGLASVEATPRSERAREANRRAHHATHTHVWPRATTAVVQSPPRNRSEYDASGDRQDDLRPHHAATPLAEHGVGLHRRHWGCPRRALGRHRRRRRRCRRRCDSPWLEDPVAVVRGLLVHLSLDTSCGHLLCDLPVGGLLQLVGATTPIQPAGPFVRY